MTFDASLAPIILFCYNRPVHLSRTLDSLKDCELSSQSSLYIFSDAPKKQSDELKVQEVRKIIQKIDGFKEVIVTQQCSNKGLAESIIAGVTDVLSKHGKVIVLEDDMLVSKQFLQFMNSGLLKYENEKTVSSICAYMFPIENLPEIFFLRHADCWGWATWTDRWKEFENKSDVLLREIESRSLIRDFNFNNSYPYFQMLLDQAAGRINSWAIRWYATNFLLNKVALYPGKSLIKNIGLDNSGTHSGIDTFMMTEVTCINLNLMPSTVIEDEQARLAISSYLHKSHLPGLRYRIVNLIRKIGIQF